MAGSDKPKKPGLILHVPSHEARARKRAMTRGGWVMPNRRARPFDFREVAERLQFVRHPVRRHYRTSERVVERWAAELGIELVLVPPAKAAQTRVSNALAPDFDPVRDGDRWRLMQAAMTLNGRAVRGEVWRKEARGEYD